MEDQKIKTEKAIRSKGGRPQKKIKRCHIYMIRLTDLEQFTIATKAKNAGTSISDFFRKSAQNGYSAEGDHVIPWQTEHVFSWRTSAANAVSAFQS